VLGVHRLLWQVEYLVSQGFYVFLDFHPTSDVTDPNVKDPALFAKNWGNLWAALAARSAYVASLKGRVIADLINEARCAEGAAARGAAPSLDRGARKPLPAPRRPGVAESP
jgi:hypothetical protein